MSCELKRKKHFRQKVCHAQIFSLIELSRLNSGDTVSLGMCPYMIVPTFDSAHTYMIVSRHDCACTQLWLYTIVPMNYYIYVHKIIC